MKNTCDKLFDLEECPVRELQKTVLNFRLKNSWPGREDTYDILNEKLRVSCGKPNEPIEFNEDEDDVFIDIPIKMSTRNWELLSTLTLCHIIDDEHGFFYDTVQQTDFNFCCFKGDPKDLKTTFMTVKMIESLEEK